MMEDKKGLESGLMQELSLDELEGAAGGIRVTESRDGFLDKSTDGFVLPGQKSEADQDAVATGAEAGSLPKMGGTRTVQAYCHMCDMRTTFTVFSGARGKCNVCGYLRLDL